MNKQIEALKIHAEKYGLTLEQFRMMCEGASKVYEGQGLNSVDYALAREAYFAGFTHACKEALAEAENESNSQPVTFNGKDYMEGFNAGKMFAELEHTAQEPVAYRFKVEVEDNHWIYNFCQYPDDKNNPKLEPLYTHPATWQSLSDEEKWNLINNSDIPADYDHEVLAIAHAIDAKLKEKNG